MSELMRGWRWPEVVNCVGMGLSDGLSLCMSIGVGCGAIFVHALYELVTHIETQLAQLPLLD